MKKLQYSTSARRDLRTWLILLVSAGFVYAGATVNPASNCDESGRECAPWLVPVALGMGLVGMAMGLGLFAFNRRWGSRLDLPQRQLIWWDSGMSAEDQRIALDEVSKIKVRHVSESSDRLFFYDQQGDLMRFSEERVVPYNIESWARDLVVHFPHIAIEVEDA